MLIAHTPGERKPLLAGLLAQVALHEKIVFPEGVEVFFRIVAAIEAVEALAFEAELFERRNATANEVRHTGLTVLFSRAQLAVEHVALGANVGKHGRITVGLLK